MQVDFKLDVFFARHDPSLGGVLVDHDLAVQLLRDPELDAGGRNLLPEKRDLGVNAHSHDVVALFVLLGRVDERKVHRPLVGHVLVPVARTRVIA